MSDEELDRLAARMRQALADQGVVSAAVRTYTPPVIALACDGAITAERVKLSLKLNAERARIEIDPSDVSTVLRYF